MKSKTEELIEWLRDAYAMEKSMEQMLRRVVDDDKVVPSVREGARIHLDETVRHAEQVEQCLNLLGADTSAMKTSTAAVGEFLKDTMASFASDKRIKDLLTGYAGEHFEIACYLAIRVAAQSLNENQIVIICDSILEDERRMAERLQESVPEAVASYLAEG